MADTVTREEFESFVAEFESFRDHILDQFSDLRSDFERLNERFEELVVQIKNSEPKPSIWQRRLG